MKLTIVLPVVVFASVAAAADVPSAQVQIAGAVLAAPAELREGAAVLGFDAHGGRVQIREGKNELICLATDPAKTAFNVACYHKDLEPFMARGRELLAQNVTGPKRNEIRFKEVEDGKLGRAQLAGRVGEVVKSRTILQMPAGAQALRSSPSLITRDHSHSVTDTGPRELLWHRDRKTGLS